MSEAAPQAAGGTRTDETEQALSYLQLLWGDDHQIGHDEQGVLGQPPRADRAHHPRGQPRTAGRADERQHGSTAVNSGFSYVRGNTGHTANPLTGSYVTEKTGEPASPLRDSDYPVIAECKICHGRIRLGQRTQTDWQHAPLQAAPAKGDGA
jgi:hypothetical protein